MQRISLLIALALAASACRSGDPGPDAGSSLSNRDLLANLPDHPEKKLTRELASRFASLSLACIDREYPNKPSNILDGDETVKPPRELTPAFFGCFDWHSAVHGHWALVRLLSVFPDLPEADRIKKALAGHLSSEKIGAELAYFQLPRNATFERPYGWGWLLRLAAELAGSKDEQTAEWARAVRPLATHLAERTGNYLERLSVPVREGTHANTAFALVHAWDYAQQVGDQNLRSIIEKRAKDFYLGDVDCPTAYEPSGEDFISPCLAEADLMRRVLPQPRFVAWLKGFLPALGSAAFRPLREPVAIRDIRDPKIGHLIGLALHRAWCFLGIATALPASDSRRAVFERLARLHWHEALRRMFDSGYGGEHWLASFAIYLATGVGF